jgi:UDP-GlcNAc:undecaprenyl-phosphate GlcNAc-1-phosphate transferase
MILIISAAMSYIITKLLLNFSIKKFYNNNWTKKNYIGNEIPIGLGLIFIPVNILILLLFYFLQYPLHFILYISSLVIIGLVGFYDDIAGEPTIKGLRGHFISLIKGKFTSGILKAIIGIIISFVVAFFVSTDIFVFTVNFLLIILATNAFNLFDLRPGRCIKFFLITSFFILLIGSYFRSEHIILLFSLIGSIAAYTKLDLQGKAMLGDAGSNLIGISVGIISVLTLPYLFNLIFVFLLILLHWYTEKKSLNTLIEKNMFLSLLDHWGRK